MYPAQSTANTDEIILMVSNEYPYMLLPGQAAMEVHQKRNNDREDMKEKLTEGSRMYGFSGRRTPRERVISTPSTVPKVLYYQVRPVFMERKESADTKPKARDEHPVQQDTILVSSLMKLHPS